jgi:hypothetical protein
VSLLRAFALSLALLGAWYAFVLLAVARLAAP